MLLQNTQCQSNFSIHIILQDVFREPMYKSTWHVHVKELKQTSQQLAFI